MVKVLNKKLGEDVYKKKGFIEELHDKYTASLRMIETGEKFKIDQSHLETVIPAIGEEEGGTWAMWPTVSRCIIYNSIVSIYL